MQQFSKADQDHLLDQEIKREASKPQREFMAEQDFKTTRNPGAEWRNESGDGPHSMTIGAPRRAHPTQNLFRANDLQKHGKV